MSMGLVILFTLQWATWVYLSVVFIEVCPKSPCIYRMSVPLSNKCVAKLWRRLKINSRLLLSQTPPSTDAHSWCFGVNHFFILPALNSIHWAGRWRYSNSANLQCISHSIVSIEVPPYSML